MERRALLALCAVVLAVPCVLGVERDAKQTSSAPVRYHLDAKNSTFVAHALRGGLLWFLGHDHLVAAREFTGVAEITPGPLAPASLEVTVQAASLAETSSAFTEQEKKIIDDELRTIVLLPDKYSEITFKSTRVVAKQIDAGRFETEIVGNLTLLGVSHEVTIPAEVTLDGDDLRARGKFSLDRSDFNVKATSAKGGTIRVRDKIKFTFDILAHRE
jgi:polyisoprenoid-binding protein YceI